MIEKFFSYQELKIRYLDFNETNCTVTGSEERDANNFNPEDHEKPTVVMLHGWGSNADLFAQAGEFLATKYHVVAPDFPGFGKSEEPKEPYDLDDYVDFAVAFTNYVLQGNSIKSAKDSEVIFLGHSHGGRVIIRLLARAAQAEQKVADHKATVESTAETAEEDEVKSFWFTVTKAILTDSAGIVPEKTEAQKKRTAEYKRYKSLLTKTGLAKIAPGLMDKLQKKYGSADYAAASPVMRQSMVKVVNTDLRDEMPSIKIPVLLIWGDADTATPLSDGKEMERLMPEAGLAVIPGGTHFCFLENPVLYNRILGSFLGL